MIFGGVEIGFLRSLREVPGLLAVTVIFVLILFRKQRLAFISLVPLGLGAALAGRAIREAPVPESMDTSALMFSRAVGRPARRFDWSVLPKN